MTAIEAWIQEARWAPSGGNAQPWKVQVTDLPQGLLLAITIREALQNQPSAADQWGAGALIGLGCYIQTLIELAPLIGLKFVKMRVNPAPSGPANYWTTVIHLEFAGVAIKQISQGFPDYVSQRTTNRFPMEKSNLPEDFLLSLKKASQLCGPKLTEMTSQRKTLIKIYSELTFVRMQNKHLFDELMHEIFDSEQSPKRLDGLPFNTLGLPKFAVVVLKFIQKWGLHFTSRLANQPTVTDSMVKPLLNCGHIFYISMDSNAPEDWVRVGLSFQAISLLVKKNNFALQPVAYNLLAFNHLFKPQATNLSDSEGSMTTEMSDLARKELGIDFSKAGILFRIGKPLQLSSSSPRRPVELISTAHSLLEKSSG